MFTTYREFSGEVCMHQTSCVLFQPSSYLEVLDMNEIIHNPLNDQNRYDELELPLTFDDFVRADPEIIRAIIQVRGLPNQERAMAIDIWHRNRIEDVPLEVVVHANVGYIPAEREAADDHNIGGTSHAKFPLWPSNFTCVSTEGPYYHCSLVLMALLVFIGAVICAASKKEDVLYVGVVLLAIGAGFGVAVAWRSFKFMCAWSLAALVASPLWAYNTWKHLQKCVLDGLEALTG
jgi:hypothetical protein